MDIHNKLVIRNDILDIVLKYFNNRHPIPVLKPINLTHSSIVAVVVVTRFLI